MYISSVGNIKIPDGLCVKCNDGILKPCIGKREKALCASVHYWPEHMRTEDLKRQDRIYFKRRPIFLASRPLCEMKFPGCTIRATEIHHTLGRGDYYLVEKTWLPVCANCHRHEIANSAEAYDKGVTLKRLEI